MSSTVYDEAAPDSETTLPASARLRDLDYLLEEQDKGNVR